VVRRKGGGVIGVFACARDRGQEKNHTDVARRVILASWLLMWCMAVLKTRSFIARAVALRIERSDAPFGNAVLNEFVSPFRALAFSLFRYLPLCHSLPFSPPPPPRPITTPPARSLLSNANVGCNMLHECSSNALRAVFCLSFFFFVFSYDECASTACRIERGYVGGIESGYSGGTERRCIRA